MNRRRSNSSQIHMRDQPSISFQQQFQRRPTDVKSKQSWPQRSRQESIPQHKVHLIADKDNSYDNRVHHLSVGSNFGNQQMRGIPIRTNNPCSHGQTGVALKTHYSCPSRMPYTPRGDANSDHDNFRYYAGQEGGGFNGSRTMNSTISQDSLTDMLKTYGPQQHGRSVDRPQAFFKPTSPLAVSRSYGIAGPQQSWPLVPYSGRNMRPLATLSTLSSAPMWNRPYSSGIPQQRLAVMPNAVGNAVPLQMMNRSFANGMRPLPLDLAPYARSLAHPSMGNRSFSTGTSTQPLAIKPYTGGTAPTPLDMTRSYGIGNISRPFAIAPAMNASFANGYTTSQPLAMVPYVGGAAAPTFDMTRSLGVGNTSQPLAMIPYAGSHPAPSPAMNRSFVGDATTQPHAVVPYTGKTAASGLSADTKQLVETVSKMKTPDEIEQACRLIKRKSSARHPSCCAGGHAAASEEGVNAAACRAKTNLIDVLKVLTKGFENLVSSLQSASGTGDTLVFPAELSDSNRELAQDLKDTQKRIDKLRNQMIEMMQELIGVLSKLVS